MCSIGEGDGPDFCSSSTRTARKGHRCTACRRMILPGEKYVATAFAYEGVFKSEKSCTECDTAIEAFGDAHDGYPFPSSLLAALQDCIEEGDEESDRLWRPVLGALMGRRAASKGAA